MYFFRFCSVGLLLGTAYSACQRFANCSKVGICSVVRRALSICSPRASFCRNTASYACAPVRELSGLLGLYRLPLNLMSTNHLFPSFRTAILYEPIASTRFFSKYDTMSALENRTLPPTLMKGTFLPCWRRRTLVAEIFNSSATSAMVNSSIVELESVGIAIKEQCEVCNRRRTVQLYHYGRDPVCAAY